jgi:uncharacterized RDD family membrane protein YckC
VAEKIFREKDEWTCPQCGERSMGHRCGHCNFCIYAGFLPRVLASIVDKAIIWSVARLFLLVRNFSLTGFCVVTVIGFLFYRFYHIGCVALWGQTPGKMAAKIKIVRIDGSPATWLNALLRNSVETLLTATVVYLEMKAISMVSSSEFLATAYSKRPALIDAFVSKNVGTIALATNAFVLSEFIVLFLNRKKRAIHDFIAGTVVIHDPRMPFFPWFKPLGKP